MANLTGRHLVILVGVLVVLFGAKKLPEQPAQSARQLECLKAR
jgi:Sec-independent protein translocase protein TatA